MQTTETRQRQLRPSQ